MVPMRQVKAEAEKGPHVPERPSQSSGWRYAALWGTCVLLLAMGIADCLGAKEPGCVVALTILGAASLVVVAVLVVAYSRHRLWREGLPLLSLVAFVVVTAIFWQCFIMMLADIEAVRMYAATTRPATSLTSPR